MAAARVTALGVEELAARLDDRFQLLTGGRTALPRHQTLRATLDWSYELLTEPELVLLRRLAVFAGAIDLEAICAVVTGAGIALPDVVDGISSLVSKSLVVAEIDATTARYRLLDTTHTYALEKLGESGENGNGSHVAMPNITGTCSSGLKRSWRCAPRSTGWATMDGTSTTCARRWAGPFRPAVTCRLARG